MTLRLREAPDELRVRRYQRAVEDLLAQQDDWTDEQVRSAVAALRDARLRVVEELAHLAGSQETYHAHQLRRLRAAIDRAAAELAARLRPIVGGAIETAWHDGSAFAAATLRSVGVHLGPSPEVGLGQVRVLQTLGGDLVTAVGHDFRARARRAVTMGVLTGQPPTAIQSTIAALLATEPARQEGRLGTIATQAERIVRNELMNAFSVANAARHDEIAAQTPDLRKWWSSAEDARVRPTHAAADGRYRPGGEVGPIPVARDYRVGREAAAFPKDPRLSPGESVNCRCVSILWHPDWFAREEGA
jgi:uncharacterized protein with gpF-like domain